MVLVTFPLRIPGTLQALEKALENEVKGILYILSETFA